MFGIASRTNLDLIAAGVAFYTMLAIFPAVTAMLSLWGLFADPMIVEEQLQVLRDVMPEEAFALLDTQARAFIESRTNALGWAGLVAILAAIWSMRAAVGALVRGIGTIYAVATRTGFWHSLAAVYMTLGLIGLALSALVSVVVVPILLAVLPLGEATAMALTVARWVLLFGVGLFGLWLLYRFGLSHALDTSRWLAPGAAFALTLWISASWGFSTYVTNFGNYDRVYGSIGAVIVLLVWVYLTAYVVLLGAAMNCMLDKLAGPGDASDPAKPPAPPIETENGRAADTAAATLTDGA